MEKIFELNKVLWAIFTLISAQPLIHRAKASLGVSPAGKRDANPHDDEKYLFINIASSDFSSDTVEIDFR